MEKEKNFLKEEIINYDEPENFDEIISEAIENDTLMEEVCTFKNFSLFEVSEKSNDFDKSAFLTEEQIKKYFPYFEYDETKHYIMMDENNLYHN